MKISVVPEETPPEGRSGPVSDFLSADIEKLMNDDITPPADVMSADAMFTAYDRELMRFKPRSRRRTWPQPIRKR